MTIVRVDHPKLSLWQSAVAQVARDELQDSSELSPSAEDVLDHPMVRATGDFVRGRHSRTEIEFTD